MKLQKASRFALYAVLELAADPARQLSAVEIAARYGVSAHHLSKVLRELGRAGLVEAERGVGGGYRLAGNAKRMTLHDVIALFEPGDAPSGAEPGLETPIGRGLAQVLAEIDQVAEATLRSISIETLLKIAARQRAPASAA